MKIGILGNCFFLNISSISYFWKILILEILHVLKNFWPRKHFWNCLNFLNVFRIFVINNNFSKIWFLDNKNCKLFFWKKKSKFSGICEKYFSFLFCWLLGKIWRFLKKKIYFGDKFQICGKYLDLGITLNFGKHFEFWMKFPIFRILIFWEKIGILQFFWNFFLKCLVFRNDSDFQMFFGGASNFFGQIVGTPLEICEQIS